MKRVLLGLLSAVMLSAGTGFAAALEPGDKAVALPRRGWVKGEETSLPSLAERIDTNRDFHPEEYIALLFWGAWSAGSDNALETVAAAQKKYPGLRVAAITRDSTDQITKFLSGKPEYPFSFLQDDANDRIFKAYLGADTIIPRIFVVNVDKVVIWNGEPVDFPDFMEQLAAGNFRLSKEKKLTPDRQKLLLSLQVGDTDAVLRHASNLLDIDPHCGVALRAALFVYETRNQPAEALKFVDKLLADNSDWVRLQMLKLELQLRAGSSAADFRRTLAAASLQFRRQPEVLNQLAWFILNRMPFRLQSPELLLEITGNAWKQLPAGTEPSLRASCAEAYARALLLIGHPAEARSWLRYSQSLQPDDSAARAMAQENDQIFTAIIKLKANAPLLPCPAASKK